jgi:hypothetical protein
MPSYPCYPWSNSGRAKKIATVLLGTIAIPQVGQHNKTKSRQGVAASCHAKLGRIVPPLAVIWIDRVGQET